VLEWGLQEGKLTGSVTDTKLRLPKSKPAIRLPYSDADTAQILQAARAEARPSIRWVQWMLAFSGMRAGDAFQLSVSNLRQASSIHYFAIHEDDAGKSVKNGERRSVSMHSALIAEGLLEYAKSLPNQSGPLFSDKELDQHGNRGGRAWNVTGLWVRRTLG